MKITKTTGEVDYIVQINNKYFTNVNMTVTVPWFNFNVLSLLNGEELFTKRTFVVNRTLYRLIMLRLMSGDVTIADAIAYARTLASTYETGVDNIYSLHNVDFSTYRATVQLAVYMHSNQVSRFEQLHKIHNFT